MIYRARGVVAATFFACAFSHAAAHAQTPTMAEPRIVGGADAAPNEYPWVAWLTGSSEACGGTLVRREWVLTAAHCFDGDRPDQLTVRLGEHDLLRDDGPEVDRSVVEIIRHPSFDSVSLDYDVMLLRLSAPVPTSDEIELGELGDLPAPGLDLTVIGWGRTMEGGPGSWILQEVDVPRVSDAACNTSYGGGLTSRMFCAGFDMGGRDACQGDSGGPIMAGRQVVGVVSWGIGCARPSLYGVYANLSNPEIAGFLSDNLPPLTTTGDPDVGVGAFDTDGWGDLVFHRPVPSSTWRTVPVLRARGGGNWLEQNFAAASWANAEGAVAIPGDFDGDGRRDVAFHQPVEGSSWGTVPVLFATDDGWEATNLAAPRYVNAAGVVAVPGDYDGDGDTDIAFHKPIEGSTWATAPILFANGDGSWRSENQASPRYIHAEGVVAVSGDFNNDGFADIAFHKPIEGSTWGTVPVLFSNGDGGWTSTNEPSPRYIHAEGVVAVAGDFNGDRRTDIAFHKPAEGATWATLPVLFADGSGAWTSFNESSPRYLHAEGVVAVVGHFDNDGVADIAFHKPIEGSTWGTVPVMHSNGDGTWRSRNPTAPRYVNAPGVVAVAGDFNDDDMTELAFHQPTASSTWGTVPVLLPSVGDAWRAVNSTAPRYVNSEGVVAVQ